MGAAMTLGIRTKLYAGFSVMLLLCAVIGVSGLLSIHQLSRDLDDMYVENLEPLRDVAEALLTVERINTRLEEAMNAPTPEERQGDLRAISQQTAELDTLLTELREDSARLGGETVTLMQTVD